MDEAAIVTELRAKLLAHHAEIMQQRSEARAVRDPLDAYVDGHYDGLLSGLSFALRYLQELSPEPVKPFDLLAPIEAWE